MEIFLSVACTVVWFAISGWIAKQLYPYFQHSFPVLSLLLAAVGTWKRRKKRKEEKKKRGGKKAYKRTWKKTKSAKLVDNSIAEPSLSYTPFQIGAEEA